MTLKQPSSALRLLLSGELKSAQGSREMISIKAAVHGRPRRRVISP